ncbi:hypothetical protein C0Z17_26200 [Trinickia caryophylli]|nr:hypothetical protein C0Z17_26200 [Trinickia caryophylli]
MSSATEAPDCENTASAHKRQRLVRDVPGDVKLARHPAWLSSVLRASRRIGGAASPGRQACPTRCAPRLARHDGATHAL